MAAVTGFAIAGSGLAGAEQTLGASMAPIVLLRQVNQRHEVTLADGSRIGHARAALDRRLLTAPPTGARRYRSDRRGGHPDCVVRENRVSSR
ncbi:hypothetical protein GCM10010256_74420 [Streptomyces coeruleorubidus]|nr:hypothetical protein GCM10010256_74420 [Streptomyces coeruleorubidus]